MPESILRLNTGAASAHSLPITLKAFVLACIGRLVLSSGSRSEACVEMDYLSSWHELFADIDRIPEYLADYLESPGPCDESLVELADRFDLQPIELLTVALVRAVEDDPMCGRAMAYLQKPVGGSRPTLGLLQMALAPLFSSTGVDWIAGSIVSGNAVYSGILQILNTDAPLPEQTLRIPAVLALAFADQPYLWPRAHRVNPESLVILPPSILKQAENYALGLHGQQNGIIAIRSASLREARSVAITIGENLGVTPIFLDADAELYPGLGPLCLIEDKLPVFEYSPALDRVPVVPEIPAYDGPRLAIVGTDGQLDSTTGSIVHWDIPAPQRAERESLWKQYLGDEDLAGRLSRDHVHSSARIMQLAQLSLRNACLDQRQSVEQGDIEQASWYAEEGNLGHLVQPIKSRIPDEALVLPENTCKELKHLLQRCRYRENLEADLGVTIRAGYQMGVRALLVGPSGTGKTLVASWLATRLGLPLYRVDLASVVSKYIGETEKNLATLLGKAEQTEIVLLFDEADSLFGKRTDIKDSNDRHANSQTNYLLQRIELYRGIVLLTSNSRSRFDSAFTRRLDNVIEFALPSPEQRRSLWQSHLGSEHRLNLGQLNQLAVASELAGGHIRNAVLAAAVQARADDRSIEFDDVLMGLETEYGKLGRQVPSQLRRQDNKSIATG